MRETSIATGNGRRGKAPPFKLKAPVIREHPQQRAITQLLTLEIARPGRLSPHGVVWFGVDTAVFLDEVPHTFAARGVVPGLADIFVIYRGRSHLLELKTEDGEVSSHQMGIALAVVIAGGCYGVARDPAEVLLVLDEWGIPRKMRTTL